MVTRAPIVYEGGVRRLALLSCFLTFSACVHSEPVVERDPVPPPAVAAPESGLSFEVVPAECELVIDGRSYGKLTAVELVQGVLPLPPGLYQVSLKYPGFNTWRAEVALGKKVERLKVELIKR